MFHYTDNIQSPSSGALIGYQVKLVDPTTGAAAPLYSDSNATPIITVSGVANTAVSDTDGSYDFWVTDGVYHFDAYMPDGVTFAKRIKFVSCVSAATRVSAAPMGYSGRGTITQITSKSTDVTLNNVAGSVTLHGAALASNAAASFALINPSIVAADVVVASVASGGTLDAYTVAVTGVGAGFCRLQVRNVSGGSLSEALVINFAVIKVS